MAWISGYIPLCDIDIIIYPKPYPDDGLGNPI